MPIKSANAPATARAVAPRPVAARPVAARPVAASAALRDAILAWYAAQGRKLAFRATTDPYAILVSEAMAQQTQAARAAEYWTRFLLEFPTVYALAEASPAAVLRAWRGLGYNRRAIALRQAAIAIVRDHGGEVPNDIEALERLPGVGPYTARAVTALAFGRHVGAVDVNVRRVLNRALGGSLDAFASAELQATADASVPPDLPGVWTHALMDVGATFCKPRMPHCDPCPARTACCYAAARAEAAPEAAPRGTAGAKAAHEAAPRGVSRAEGERPAPFRTTNRWLRGQILNLLRDSPGDAWARIPASIGPHGPDSVATALSAMEREGLLERHPRDLTQARLPIH